MQPDHSPSHQNHLAIITKKSSAQPTGRAYERTGNHIQVALTNITTSPTKHIAQPHNTHLHPSNPQAQTKRPRPTRTSTPNTRKITTFQARTFRAPLNYKWKFWSVSLTRRSIKAHPADYPSCLVSSQATGSRGDET
jgi:hypothetical protein